MRDDHYVMIKRDNGVWYYYVYRFGKRVYRSTGETKRSEALCVINSRLLAGDLLNDAEKTRPKTFAEFSDPFWIWGRCPILTDRIARGGHFTKGLAYTNRKNVDKYLLPTFGGSCSRRSPRRWSTAGFFPSPVNSTSLHRPPTSS